MNVPGRGPDRRGDTHAPLADGTPLAEAAAEAFLAAIAAVDPTVLVRKSVRQGLLDDWFGSREKPRPIQVLAIGKAAPRMLWGLVEANVPFRGIGVTPKGVAAPNVDTFRWHPGNHPLPDKESFAAGRAVLDWAKAFPAGEPLLFLLSGGSSSCVEVPLEGTDEGLRAKWKEWLAAGLSIEGMNRQRASASAIKGGRLGALLLGRTDKVRAWVLADADPATAAETIGSSLLFQRQDPGRIPHHILAGCDEAVAAAGLRLGAMGFEVYRHGARISGDARAEVATFLDAFDGLPKGRVALVGGGEPTVRYPMVAPPGGRSQHAATLAASELAKRRSKALFFAAGTDGIDGFTDAAGAWVTARDGGLEAEEAARGFDTHRYLASRKRLLHTGATGTNVNDVWMCLRDE